MKASDQSGALIRREHQGLEDLLGHRPGHGSNRVLDHAVAFDE